MAIVADQIRANSGALPPGVASVGAALGSVEEKDIRTNAERALVNLVDPAITTDRQKHS